MTLYIWARVNSKSRHSHRNELIVYCICAGVVLGGECVQFCSICSLPCSMKAQLKPTNTRKQNINSTKFEVMLNEIYLNYATEDFWVIKSCTFCLAKGETTYCYSYQYGIIYLTWGKTVYYLIIKWNYQSYYLYSICIKVQISKMSQRSSSSLLNTMVCFIYRVHTAHVSSCPAIYGLQGSEPQYPSTK